MRRDELIEWIVMILCILLWWPVIFSRTGTGLYTISHSPWYFLVAGPVVVAVLIAIFVRRFRRMKAGLDHSEQVVRSQRHGFPVPNLDDDERRKPRK